MLYHLVLIAVNASLAFRAMDRLATTSTNAKLEHTIAQILKSVGTMRGLLCVNANEDIRGEGLDVKTLTSALPFITIATQMPTARIPTDHIFANARPVM